MTNWGDRSGRPDLSGRENSFPHFLRKRRRKRKGGKFCPKIKDVVDNRSFFIFSLFSGLEQEVERTFNPRASLCLTEKTAAAIFSLFEKGNNAEKIRPKKRPQKEAAASDEIVKRDGAKEGG